MMLPCPDCEKQDCECDAVWASIVEGELAAELEEHPDWMMD